MHGKKSKARSVKGYDCGCHAFPALTYQSVLTSFLLFVEGGPYSLEHP